MHLNPDATVSPSRYLGFRLYHGQYIARNDLTGKEKIIPLGVMALLRSISDGIQVGRLIQELGKLYPGSTLVVSAVHELITAGILTQQGTPLADRERFFERWVWDRDTAMHFLATRRTRWLGEEAEVQVFGSLLRDKKAPSLWSDLANESDKWKPIGVDIDARDSFRLFARRRSLRQFGPDGIDSAALGAILSAGLGIHGFLDLPFRLTHPLRFTPSPGGLNAFDCYLLAKNIHGLEQGTYLYNSHRNQVRRSGPLPAPPYSRLFGNQAWADEAPLICVLCANYDKMAWKYSDPSAFNSLLIESGHIAQNMMVCAAALSIGSVPTNALDQDELEQIFHLTFPDQAAVYAVAFGYEDPARCRDHYSAERLAQLKAVISEGQR